MSGKNRLLVFSMFVLLAFSLPTALADEDEYEEEEDEMRFGFGDDDERGFGETEREREREHEDDDELAIGSGTADLILYVTIGAIVASIGYTGFKILRTKRAQAQKLR